MDGRILRDTHTTDSGTLVMDGVHAKTRLTLDQDSGMARISDLLVPQISLVASGNKMKHSALLVVDSNGIASDLAALDDVGAPMVVNWIYLWISELVLALVE